MTTQIAQTDAQGHRWIPFAQWSAASNALMVRLRNKRMELAAQAGPARVEALPQTEAINKHLWRVGRCPLCYVNLAANGYKHDIICPVYSPVPCTSPASCSGAGIHVCPEAKQHAAFQMREDPLAMTGRSRTENYGHMLYGRSEERAGMRMYVLDPVADPVREEQLTTARLALDVVAHLYR